MDLTPKQQTSEAIRQADSILLLTGQHPSIDQATALVGLAMILRKFGKQVAAVMSDNPPQAVASLEAANIIERSVGGPRDFVMRVDLSKAEVDKLRYDVDGGKLNVIVTPYRGNFSPSDVSFDYGEASAHFDLVIVLGVPTRVRIDKAYEQNAGLLADVPVVNLDFHRSNENYGAVNLIDPNASSLCEILVALSESLQGGIIDAEIATPFLMGLVASTDRFTATHTTSKSLTVAAQMMAAGAKQQQVVKALYRDGRGGDNSRNDRGGEGGRGSEGRDKGQQSRRESGESRRDAKPEPVRQQPEPAVAAVPQPVIPVNLDAAVRQADTSPELPIIPPRHIEPSLPAEQPVVAPAPATAQAVLKNEPAAANDGQLPPEMSPLVGLGIQNVALSGDDGARIYTPRNDAQQS